MTHATAAPAAAQGGERLVGREAGVSGIIVLDKPTGLPSNRVLGQVKRLVGESKMGFLGTLDPLASGVLPVFVGKATRLIALFEGLSKTYRVTMKLGERTNTFDAEGEVIERRPLGGLTPERIQTAILAKAGKQRQTVPKFSAVKVGGVPAYKLARKGEEVPERIRDVELWDLQVEACLMPEVTFRVSCTAGTYIRSLVEDLGQELGVGAHVVALRRLASGTLFRLEESVSLEGIGECLKAGRMDCLKNPAEFLRDHATLTISPEMELQLRDGRTVALEALAREASDDVPRQVQGWTEGLAAKALRPDGGLAAVGQIVKRSDGALGFQPSRVLI
jgi:tRNA pseudouridine55 synthase